MRTLSGWRQASPTLGQGSLRQVSVLIDGGYFVCVVGKYRRRFLLSLKTYYYNNETVYRMCLAVYVFSFVQAATVHVPT